LMRTLRRPLRTSWLMVGIRGDGGLQSGNLGKEVDATLHPKLGKNFFGQISRMLRGRGAAWLSTARNRSRFHGIFRQSFTGGNEDISLHLGFSRPAENQKAASGCKS
jgi:hypothetical protein